MFRPSPFAGGFRAVRREPAALLIEIVWRWLFGGIAIALTAWAVLLFLRQVEVSPANRVLLGTLNPELMTYAVRDIFHDKWGLLARLGLTVAGSLSLLWVLMATVGRGVMLRVLVEEVGSHYDEKPAARANLPAIGALQFLRVALLWVGFAVYLAASFGTSALTTINGQPHIGAFLLIFLSTLLVAMFVLSFCNWILQIAAIPAVRENLSWTSAILASGRLSRRRSGQFISLNLAHLALRVIWFVFMTGLAFVPLGFARILPKIVVWAGMALVSLFYFAVADWLFVARFAGYIEIAEQELHPAPPPMVVPVAMQPDPVLPVEAPASDHPAPEIPEPPLQ